MSEQNAPLNSQRREFVIKSSALAAGTLIAPGVMLYAVSHAKAPEQAVSNQVRWGMLIDSNQCATNCNDCVTACHDYNGIQNHGRETSDAQWIRKVTLKDKQTGRESSLPVMCQHCEHPPCTDVCPTGASFKRADGIVLVDKHICIGCRYCMMACPYKARSFVHEDTVDQKVHAPRGKGTVEACTMCVHRVDNGQQPACVEACSNAGHHAILFGDLHDPNSEIAKKLATEYSIQLRPDLNLNNGVRYQGV